MAAFLGLMNKNKKGKVTIEKYEGEFSIHNSVIPTEKRKFCPRKRKNNKDGPSSKIAVKTGVVLTVLLNQKGTDALLSTPSGERYPLFLADIIHLLIKSYFGVYSSVIPRWCFLNTTFQVQHVCVLVIKGISTCDFSTLNHCFPYINKQMSVCQLEVVSPQLYSTKLPQELSVLPVIINSIEKYIQKPGDLVNFLRLTEARTKIFRCLFPVDHNQETTKYCSKWKKDKFPRTQLLLSPLELAQNDYPLLLDGACNKRFSGFIFTKETYKEVSDESPMFAIDCEMCITSGQVCELTEVALVNEKLKCVYKSLVKPEYEIVGKKKHKFIDVTTTLKDVQDFIRAFLPCDAILVGHNLASDLNVLKMLHPYVIDTSLIFNLSGSVNTPPKLSVLSQMFLDDAIQNSDIGHSAEQDSIAAMKLVQMKLSQSYGFGNAILGASTRSLKPSTLSKEAEDFVNRKHRAAVIGTKKEIKKYCKYIRKIKCKTGEDINMSDIGPDCIQFSQVESQDEAVTETCSVVRDRNLVISNLCVTDSENKEQSLLEIDRYCKKIVDCSNSRSLNVVIFSGCTTCSVFICVKE